MDVTAPRSERPLAVVLLILSLLALRVAYLWWPLGPEGDLQIVDHAPLYFLLSVGYLVCAAGLGVGLWVGSTWTHSFVYAWAGVLTALGVALLLFDPFGRGAAGYWAIALEIMGIVAFVRSLRTRIGRAEARQSWDS